MEGVDLEKQRAFYNTVRESIVSIATTDHIT